MLFSLSSFWFFSDLISAVILRHASPEGLQQLLKTPLCPFALISLLQQPPSLTGFSLHRWNTEAMDSK